MWNIGMCWTRIVKRKSACAFCMRCLLGLATGKRLGSMQRIPAPIGFLAAEEHTDAACEIAVMGVLPEYHRQGIGCTLLRLCAHSYVARGYRYLTVKTLADTVGSASYVKTRAFYLACGFEPLEIFETLWNEENPCLYLVKPLFDGQGTKPMEF